MSPELFVSIVTWNSATFLDRTLRAATSASESDRVKIFVIDNASQDNSVAICESNGVEVLKLKSNQGFCGGQNEGVKAFLNSNAKYLCFMNPDVLINGDTWEKIFKSLHKNPSAAAITPKLIRAKEDLTPFNPNNIDAAGMILTSSLRHFDRGSEEVDNGQFEHTEYVFGGTGAFLILRKEAVKGLLLPNIDEKALRRVIPELEIGDRPQLFDEAFFAFREDADLAWRMKGTRLQFLYDPSIQAFHVRKVTPERRSSLPDELNAASVRNRFLLQINNWSFSDGLLSIFCGLILRNIIVVVAVFIKEQSSLKGLCDLMVLLPRAIRMRREVKKIRNSLQ